MSALLARMIFDKDNPMDRQYKDDRGREREGKMIPLTPGQPASDVLYNQHGTEGAISTKQNACLY